MVFLMGLRVNHTVTIGTLSGLHILKPDSSLSFIFASLYPLWLAGTVALTPGS